ncbi:MAG: hypothetical protein E7637_03440 [Ruminococcaceae bacterium]|nr:hypothetical protein [Oscillospiraceae bacterium]
MKRRRTIITSLLLIAALALGIGYAAITGSLIVDGKVVAAAQPFNVHFIAFEAGTGTGVLSNIPEVSCDTTLSETNPAKSIMLNVRNMASDGDTVSATLTIKNDNDCDMYVSVDTILYGETAGTATSATPNYFTVTTDWTAAKKIDKGATATIKVTIEMDKSCTEDYTGYFRVTLNGTSVAPTP